MAKNSSNRDSEYLGEFERKEDLARNHYFDNETVERLLHFYVEGACTDVSLRNEIMTHASELIENIIKAHNLGQICPGKDEASKGDLFQTAWVQIESALYKYEARPHCNIRYNKLRPSDSLIIDEYMFEADLVKKMHNRCPVCGDRLESGHIYYKGKSKVFNMWCVSPNTRVITQNGIKTINDALDTRNLFYGIGGLKEVVNTIRKPKQETHIIKTALGYMLEATPEHMVMRLDGWTKVKDLREGDFVGIQYSQQHFGNNNYIGDIKVDGWDVPDEITPELAYLFGLYISDGSFGVNTVIIYNVDIEITEILQNNSLDLNFAYASKTTANYTCNKGFKEFMIKLGFKEHIKAPNKEIPTRLMQMSKDNINALLSGLFDRDGHSNRFNGSVGFTSTSKVLIEQVRMLLLNSGMLTKLSTDDRKIRHFVNRYGKKYDSKLAGSEQLYMSSIDSLRFYDRIGFRIKRKQDKMAKLPVPKEILYCVCDAFRRLYEKYGAVGYYDKMRRIIAGSNTITVVKAMTMLHYYDQFTEDDDYRFISERIDEYYRFKNKVIWLPVKNLSESNSEVCDVEIDSEDHSYIANGFISHNSQIARTVALAYIKKENRDRKNSGVFQQHLEERATTKNEILGRFFAEAREICKYNRDHMHIIACIEELYQEDEKPYEGLIGKLVERSKFPRTTVTGFLKVLRLRSNAFSDSPVNEENEQKVNRDKDVNDSVNSDQE